VIYELRHNYAVSRLLKTAKLPRSSYYYYAKRLNKEDKYKEIKAKIKEIFAFHKGRYGYRRITMELRNQGTVINHKTVLRLMKESGLFCRVRMKKYRSYHGEVGKIAPNLLERNFKTEKLNERWVTDVTQFELFGQKIYLSPIIDLHNGEVVFHQS
jgi:putative transposase